MKNIIVVLIAVAVVAIGFTMFSGGDKAETNAAKPEKKVLRVGMDLRFPPYSYIDEKGNPAGFEPVISKAFAEYLGMEVEIVNTSFSLLLPALETGDVDILIADMAPNPERIQKADFSNPYRYSQTLVVLNKEFALANKITDDTSIDDFFKIPDLKFIGLTGTFGVTVPQSYGADVTEVTEKGLALLEISTGQSNAMTASNEAHSYHAANKDTTIVYSGLDLISESCFVVRKGDTEMLTKSNEFIKTMYEEGGLYDQIRDEFNVIIGDFLQNDELGLDYIINRPGK